MRTAPHCGTCKRPSSRHGGNDVAAETELVRAAGCVLWRRRPTDGAVEVALIHRPRYDDWSHPKGKLMAGESEADAAVREVLEETGMRCELGARLPTTRYTAEDRPKVVTYWEARATSGAFVPNDEVDRMVWLAPATARRHLSNPWDRPLLDAAAAAWDGETPTPADAPTG
ncbi:NUDIX hydrolase [Streptomyces bohaiensis]|uniref:NUDIX hydrolase n=1 Tax=Streptomyces bohaiensis TaxID=1431344 RepID=A0ABX1CC99_9ACTN|nr:NUDIX hydrolase [Streptomyces bohaiensis]